MLHFQINPHSGVPVYRQLMDQVKYYASSGTLNSGDKLPSIRALAKSLTVNPTTIIKAYSELEHAGVIEMRHGKGAFLAESASKLSARERQRELARLARQFAVEAVQLGISKDELFQAIESEWLQIRETDSGVNHG